MVQTRSVLDIPIFHKIYELYKLLHSYHHKVPKSERYTLWQKCEALIETSHHKGEQRLYHFHIISNKLDLLKVLVRLAKETRTIDNKQYLEIQTIIQEIGKMVGGWIKSVPH
jgi:hypothetical protein